jgi:hypothetical protein
MKFRNINCAECQKQVDARLVSGDIVYPHRKDLSNLKFWQCGFCLNFVGTHKNSKDNNPLGAIVGSEIKKLRMEIHNIIDPLWKDEFASRKKIYLEMAIYLGLKEYHTANIINKLDADKAIVAANKLYDKYIEDHFNF